MFRGGTHMNRRNDNSGIIAGIIVIGLFLFIGLIVNESKPECIKAGCDREQTDGSSYCYLHEHFSDGSSYKSSYTNYGSSSSTTYSDSANNSEASSSSSKTSTSSNKNKTGNSNPYSSYDEGYEDVYDGDDYDWDRYWEDDDYADGVDDAMEDCDW